MLGALARRMGGDGLSIGRILIACMAVGFLSLVAAGAAAAWLTRQGQDYARAVSHTYAVQAAIAEASSQVERVETTRRGYIITGREAYRVFYRGAVRDMESAVERVRQLTTDNPRQQATFADLSRRLDALSRLRERTVQLVSQGQGGQAVVEFRRETDLRPLRTIRARLASMLTEEQDLLRIRERQQDRSVRSFYTVLAVTGVLLLAVALLSLFTVLRYTRDLAASRGKLQQLNATLEDQVTERTAELSRANDEIQRFAYIVSHDLRSPLVNVMGFTAELDAAGAALRELVDRAEERVPDIVTEEARLAAREDLPEAVGFIRTSTSKMDRLINAILRLSREGRRTLTPEPVDIAALGDAIGESMQHRMDERDVSYSVERPLPALNSDRLAVEQILSNLVENAVKYMAPGRPGRVTLSGREERGRVVLSVADNGRGIAPSDHQRIFDLFRRSGQQDQPGEGIGLAHVRALAYRLGGTISVDSELGRGSTFHLNLPRTLETP
jgi:signal transduction histidine kinase